MEKLQERIYDALTGEITYRDLTDEQMEEVEAKKLFVAQLKAEDERREAVKQSALNKLIDLGLTEDEAKAFLG